MFSLLTVFALAMTARAGLISHIGARQSNNISTILTSVGAIPSNFSQSPHAIVPGTQQLGPITGNMTFSPTSSLNQTVTPGEHPADTPFPASLLLCQESDCGDCVTFDLSTAPQDACLQSANPDFEFVSVGISQPSDTGLPFAVVVGPGGCSSFAGINNVNTCFDITTDPFTQFALMPPQ